MLATIIAIEGPDKVGKFTQSNMLVHKGKHYGLRTKLIEVPFNDKLTYKLIYRMLKSGTAKRFPTLFQIIQFMNKFFFQFTYLLWLRLTYDYIVLDRWSLSAIIYGNATGSNKFLNKLMYHMLISPKLTFVLYGKSFDRKEEENDSYESDNTLQSIVRAEYVEWALDHTQSHSLIYCDFDRDSVHEEIFDVCKFKKVICI